ncbi:MAG: MarR family transcriptional regulator [Dehalococcoidia bacterium]|nr:MarR family transcriptional regulator [Dehalococcoidia bacterium]
MSRQPVEELEAIKKEVVELSERFYRYSRTPLPSELVKADLTMSQLKLLLIISTEGQSTMSQVAVALGIALPTATGIVDRLVERDLIVRKADRLDRRVVLCALSEMGAALVERLWELGKEQMYSVLHPLDLEELRAVSKALNILCKAAQIVHLENTAAPRPPV